MADIELTPEQERHAQEAFKNRRFDPDGYAADIMGPEIPAPLQVEIAEQELREYETRTPGTAAALEELARQKELSERVSRDFCFLDPADYEDKAARIGRVLHCRDFLRLLQTDLNLECWYSLADEGMIAREPNVRDIGLAYRKIAEKRENVYEPDRWSDAIREIKQEQGRKQPLHADVRFGLQICRQPGKPEYCTWVPAAAMTEFGDVLFDSHGIPLAEARGWRTVLIQIIIKQFVTEEDAHRAFHPAEGPGARRYNMILSGLRNQPASARATEAPIEITQPSAVSGGAEVTEEQPQDTEDETGAAASSSACGECSHRFAHYLGCSKYEAWLKGEEANVA